MRKYGDDLPDKSNMAVKNNSNSNSMSQAADAVAVAAAAEPEALAAVSAAKMRCGGCGGKVWAGGCKKTQTHGASSAACKQQT